MRRVPLDHRESTRCGHKSSIVCDHVSNTRWSSCALGLYAEVCSGFLGQYPDRDWPWARQRVEFWGCYKANEQLLPVVADRLTFRWGDGPSVLPGPPMPA